MVTICTFDVVYANCVKTFFRQRFLNLASQDGCSPCMQLLTAVPNTVIDK